MYRRETPKSIEEALEWHPSFATIIPEIEHYEISQETISTLKQNYKNVTMNRGTKQVITKSNERILVFIDISDIAAKGCYSEKEAEDAEEEKFERWYYYESQGINCCKFDITPYIHIDDIHEYNEYQGYNSRTKTYKNKIDFSVYYTSDGNIFISPTLAEILKISNIDKLAKELEEEKGKPYIKE